MRDTLEQSFQSGSGIPDIGVRIIIAVCLCFALLVLITVLYFKMKEKGI